MDRCGMGDGMWDGMDKVCIYKIWEGRGGEGGGGGRDEGEMRR